MNNRERAEQIDRDLNLTGEADIEYLTRALDAAVADALKRPEGKLPPVVADMVESLEAQLAERDAQCAVLRETLTEAIEFQSPISGRDYGIHKQAMLCSHVHTGKCNGACPIYAKAKVALATDAGTTRLERDKVSKDNEE